MSQAEMLLGGSENTSPFFDKFDWSLPVPEQVVAVRGLLKGCTAEELAHHVRLRHDRMSPAQLDELDAVSDYKPLSNKICVARGDYGNGHYYKVLLHSYKEPSWRPDSKRTGPVYVEQYHNHRHGIVSFILEGGYEADEFRLTNPDQEPLDAVAMGSANWREMWTDHLQTMVPRSQSYAPGDVMSMHPDEVHRLQRIREGTATLLIELPKIRDYSIGHDTAGTRATDIFYDLSHDRRLAVTRSATAAQTA